MLCHRWTLISHSLFVHMHNSEGEVAFARCASCGGFRSLFFHLYFLFGSFLTCLHECTADLPLRAVIHLFTFNFIAKATACNFKNRFRQTTRLEVIRFQCRVVRELHGVPTICISRHFGSNLNFFGWTDRM